MVNNLKPDLTYYDNYKEVYQRPEGYFDFLANEIIGVFGNKNLTILDIGCGFGDFLKSFEKNLKERGQYYGLTIAKHEYDYVYEKLKFIEIKLGKQQDIISMYPNKRFDIIISFHTLSYIPQNLQEQVVNSMSNLLNKNGIIVLGLIDDWIKFSNKVSQCGNGCVQFYYSPLIFKELNYCNLLSSPKSDKNYRIQIWGKDERYKDNIYLILFYTIRNNIFFVPLLTKIMRRIFRLLKVKK